MAEATKKDNNLILSESIALLTDIIFNREIIEGRPPIFLFSQHYGRCR